MSTPVVSVIVPHFNQPAALAQCLESLMAQSIDPASFEVIVGNNGGIDDPAALLRLGDNIRIVRETRRGAAHARNAALREARGAKIAFTDADCVTDAHWLAAGLSALDAADYVGGAIAVTVADPSAMTATEAFERVFAFRQRLYVEQKSFSATANLFVTRAAADKIGPFKPGVSEDVDWGERAGALGLRSVFDAKAIVNHPARSSWDELVSKWDRMIRERWNGYRSLAPESRADRVRWIMLAGATALSWAPHLWTVASTDRLTRVRDRLAAAGVLIRLRCWRGARMIAVMQEDRLLSVEKKDGSAAGAAHQEEVYFASE